MAEQENHASQNSMGQLAQMYRMIEEHLRKEELSLAGLRMKDDIHKTEKSNWQVRDILKVLDKHKCLIKLGTGRGMTYKWDPAAPAFTLNLRAQAKAVKEPSPVVVAKPHNAPKQMEVEFAGVILTLGVNPDTGLFRIIVDQKPGG